MKASEDDEQSASRQHFALRLTRHDGPRSRMENTNDGGNMGAGKSGKENLASEKPTDDENMGSQKPRDGSKK